MIRLIFLALWVLVVPAHAQKATEEEAGRYTCDDVRWAKENLSAPAIALIKARMTKDQLSRARACLAANPSPVHSTLPAGSTTSWERPIP